MLRLKSTWEDNTKIPNTAFLGLRILTILYKKEPPDYIKMRGGEGRGILHQIGD